MLNDEIIEALNILESCGVCEEARRNILIYGLSFNFSYGSDREKRDRHYDIFEFTSMIKNLIDMGINVDVNAIIKNPTNYEEVITISESVLPREYWDVLDDRGDNTLMEAIEWHEKTNAFAPHKQEGPVKKLTRF